MLNRFLRPAAVGNVTGECDRSRDFTGSIPQRRNRQQNSEQATAFSDKLFRGERQVGFGTHP